MVRLDSRGQAFTLEGFVAALLLLATVAFVLNATAVTPLSSSTSSHHVESQGEALVAGVLDSAAANESLRPTLLYWNDSTGQYHGATVAGTYTNCALPTEFGALVTRTLYDQGWACNVNVRYLNSSNGTTVLTVRPVVDSGTPSDNAVRAVRTVTLYDDEVLYNETSGETNTTLASASTFYVPDADPSSGLYAVVEVEVVVWRT
ncbi:DUF7288 family protein [Halorarius litoreus]|uniref:DUF7288 family protein n=1 Tax=Halorarius litoreus TaxID=2962676 RepID=UPI0020CF42A8|nr:hypothetical protein [Halorarius litoreus]